MPSNREYTNELINVLHSMHDKLGDYFNESGLLPLRGSIAAREIEDFEIPELVETAFSQGFVLIESAADHIYTITKSVTEPAGSISPLTCSRAVLETSALSAWLMDTEIDVNERLKRSYAFRYEGLRQQIKYLRSAKHTNELIKATEDRINKIEKEAIKLGFKPIVNQKNKRDGIGQRMPIITDIVKTALNEESYYRLLSAVTHGHHWALQNLSFDVDEIGGRPVLRKCLTTEIVLLICYKATLSFARPCWYLSRLYGWDSDKLVYILEEVANKMKIKYDRRFWLTDSST